MAPLTTVLETLTQIRDQRLAELESIIAQVVPRIEPLLALQGEARALNDITADVTLLSAAMEQLRKRKTDPDEARVEATVNKANEVAALVHRAILMARGA